MPFLNPERRAYIDRLKNSYFQRNSIIPFLSTFTINNNVNNPHLALYKLSS